MIKKNINNIILVGGVILCAITYYLLLPSVLARVDGGCSERSSPYMAKYFNDERKITFCESGDAYVGEIRSEVFQGESEVYFSYAGYSNNKNISVRLISSGHEIAVINLMPAGERWLEYKLTIPSNLIGADLRLVAIDDSTENFGWIGLANIERKKIGEKTSFVLKVFTVLLLVLVVYSLVLYVLMLRLDLVDAAAALLVFVGIVGNLVFYLYIIHPILGRLTSILLMVGGFLYLAHVASGAQKVKYIDAFIFLSPVSLLSLIIIFIGYYPFHFENIDLWKIGAMRWLDLPIDSWIPKIFGDQIYRGELLRPMIGDWLSSDRPPLQTGVYLIFNILRNGDDVVYQTVATMLQALVLIPIWLLILKFKCGSAQKWMIFTFSFSSLFVVNLLFVWPKLISAAYVLICYYYLNVESRGGLRNFMIGASASLALLSHGGAFFALFGIFVFWLGVNCNNFQRSTIWNALKWVFVGLIIMMPWIYYGKYIDPQYSRLIKWHLAGLIEPSNSSLWSVVYSAYADISLEQWLDGRLSNFSMVTKGFVAMEPSLWSLDFKSFIYKSREQSFFNLFYSLWFFSPFVVCPFVFYYGLSKLPNLLMNIFISAVIGFLFWMLLMFIPGSAFIHHGSFFGPIVLLMFGQVALWLYNVNIFRFASILNFLLFILLYAISPGELAIDVAYLVVFSILLFLYWKSLGAWDADVLSIKKLI